MALTVKNLLKVPYASKLELVAGEAGINNVIMRTHVLEIIEYMDFVQKGDLIITIGYVLGNNKALWEEFIYQLYEKEIAGIAIDTERLHQDTLDIIKKACADCGCPLFLMPVQMRSADLQQSIFKVIYNEGTSVIMAEKFFLELMYNAAPLSQGKINRAKKYGFDDNASYRFVDVEADLKSFESGSKNQTYTGIDGNVYRIFAENPLEQLKEMIENIVAAFDINSYVIGNGDKITLLMKDDKPDGHIGVLTQKTDSHIGVLTQKADSYISVLKQKLDELGLVYRMGVSGSFEGLGEMARHYDQAAFALSHAIMPNDNVAMAADNSAITTEHNIGKVVFFDELGVKAILHNCQDKKLLEAICHNVLAPILDDSNISRREENLKTLKEYYSCNCSYEATAEEMFCHSNTIRNRIADIYERLGVGKNDFNAMFNVKVALDILNL